MKVKAVKVNRAHYFLTDPRTKDRSDASKNDDFSIIIVNSEIKKAIIATSPKQPERPFPKDPLQSSRLFSTNYYHYVTQSGLKL